MNRRNFLHNSCLTCLGLASISISLSGCSTIQMYSATVSNKKIIIPLNAFKPGENKMIVRSKEIEDDILLVKRESHLPIALSLICTHQNFPLTVTANGIHCNNHGSEFDFEGNVIKNPAVSALKQYTVMQDQANIIITI